VTLTAPLGNLFSAAYNDSFNPGSLCANYLADAGLSTGNLLTPDTYSFNVGANAIFVVTVNEVDSGTGGAYTLDVSGGDCRPVLNIAEIPGNKVQLDWTTASSAGYGLESTNIVPAPTPWPPVTNVPVALNGRFTVTNNISTTNRFFRLRKPLP
jgi:hypothetical protein